MQERAMPLLLQTVWPWMLALLAVFTSEPVSAHDELLRLSGNIRPSAYQLALDIDPRAPSFSGKVIIDLDIVIATDRIVLHAAQLTFDALSVTADGTSQALMAQTLDSDGAVALVAGNTLRPGKAVLTIRYHANFASGLEGLYTTHDGGRSYAFTQLEAIGARRVFPCFDEPGFKAPFKVSLTVPRGMQAISNTLEVGLEPAASGRVIHSFAPSRPLPTYLLAFAVGDFDIVEAADIGPSPVRRWSIPLRGIAVKGKGAELHYALAATAPLLKKTEDWFGIAYPFDKLDIIAVPEFGAVGMENAGAITYEESLVLLDDDATLQRRREFVKTHAHEIAHQWFGNDATPRWWDDLWLNEAMATFMETKVASWWKPQWRFETDRQLAALEAMQLDLLPSVRRVHEPVSTTDGISAAFDSITYAKGAALIGMAEAAMGEENFRQFVHAFLSRHAFSTMDQTGFLKEMADADGGADAARIISSAIDQPGLPHISVDRHCDAGHESLLLRQSQLQSLVWPKPEAATAGPTWVTRVCLKPAQSIDVAVRCFVVGQPATEHAVDGDFCRSLLIDTGQPPGYFALSLPEADSRDLIKKLPYLPRFQALGAAAHLEIALATGRIGLRDYLDAVRGLAANPDTDVRAFPLERLSELLGNAVEPSRQQTLREFARTIYGPQLEAIGLTRPLSGNDTASWLLELYREKLVDTLVEMQVDPVLQARLATIGRQIAADTKSALDESPFAPPDVVSAALIAASRAGGKEFLDQATQRLGATEDSSERSQWLAAIASNHAPESSQTIDRLSVSEALPGQDSLALLFDRASEPPYRPEAWGLVQRRLNGLLQRLDGDLDLALIEVADGFCSLDRAGDVEHALAPSLGRIRGGTVQLRLTVDRIRQCALLSNRLNAEPLAGTADLRWSSR